MGCARLGGMETNLRVNGFCLRTTDRSLSVSVCVDTTNMAANQRNSGEEFINVIKVNFSCRNDGGAVVITEGVEIDKVADEAISVGGILGQNEVNRQVISTTDCMAYVFKIFSKDRSCD